MIERSLGPLQVASLLVSASYGIGFLFGAGEYAIRHGMGGAIYGVATGIGMLALGVFAGRLWQARRNLWDLFGDRFGDGVGRLVALLSVVWMAGVLAAQIHGVSAVLRQLGAPPPWAAAVGVGLILGASRFRLQRASLVFSGCLAGSAIVLVYALLRAHGTELYRGAVPDFVHALTSIGLVKSLTIAVGIGLLVCTGADYHQFVLAARDRNTAIVGCLLAGLALLMLAFLPPAVVVASMASPDWSGVMDAKQAIPHALALAAHDFSASAGALMLAMLGLAALGSGAAILRAMVSALDSAQRGIASYRPLTLAFAALGAATTLTASGLPIVDTMVSVNVVYIASVGVSLAALLRRGPGAVASHETWVMGAGFSASVAGYLLAWLTGPTDSAELFALSLGLASASLVRLALARRRRRELACHSSDG